MTLFIKYYRWLYSEGQDCSNFFICVYSNKLLTSIKCWQNYKNIIDYWAVADLGGATGGHGPPKRFKKKIFFTPLKKEIKNFCYVTLVFKELRLLDYTPALEIGPENSVNYPPSNSRNPSTTPPLEIGPENSANNPPPRIYGRNGNSPPPNSIPRSASAIEMSDIYSIPCS